MQGESFDVYYEGPAEGQSEPEVVAALSRAFQVAPERIQVLVRQPGGLVKSGLDGESARRYEDVFTTAGARVRVQARSTVPGALPLPTASAPPLAASPSASHAPKPASQPPPTTAPRRDADPPRPRRRALRIIGGLGVLTLLGGAAGLAIAHFGLGNRIVRSPSARQGMPPTPRRPMAPDASECFWKSGSRRDDCYAAHAEDHRAPDSCLRVRDSRRRTTCLSRLAPLVGDSTWCDEVEDAAAHFECVSGTAAASHDPKQCTVLRGGAAERCVVRALADTKRVADCVILERVGLRDECLSGLQQLDALDCRFFTSLRLRDECYSRLASTAPRRLCLEIRSRTLRNQCFIQAATNDPTLCNQLSLERRLECWSGLLGQVKDREQCRGAPRELVTKCVLELAKREGSPALCDVLGDHDVYARCLIAAAVAPDPCIGLDQEYLPGCLIQHLDRIRDPRQCDALPRASTFFARCRDLGTRLP